MLPRTPLPDDEERAAFLEPRRPSSKPAGAYYRTQAPLYHYRDAPSSAGEGIGNDAGVFVGLVVCLCLLLLLAFAVSYPLSNYYYYTPEPQRAATTWMHGHEVYVRPP